MHYNYKWSKLPVVIIIITTRSSENFSPGDHRLAISVKGIVGIHPQSVLAALSGSYYSANQGKNREATLNRLQRSDNDISGKT